MGQQRLVDGNAISCISLSRTREGYTDELKRLARETADLRLRQSHHEALAAAPLSDLADRQAPRSTGTVKAECPRRYS
jgi:hypothetical protein